MSSTAHGEIAIKPSQVRVGVYVRIPLPWMHHSFLTSSFLVTTEAQAREIAALGVDVFYDPQRSKTEPSPLTVATAPDPAREAELARLREQQEALVQLKRERAMAMEQMRSRRAAVQKSFTSAAEQAATAFRQLAARPKESVQAIRDVAEESTRTLLADPNSTILMVADKGLHHGDIGHAMSVMTLSLLVAKQLGLAEPVIQVIGMGALLHDIGIGSLSHSLVRNPARNKFEEASYQTHCQLGLDELRRVGSGVPQAVLDVVLQHHEREDGKGYPAARSGSAINLPAKLIGIADRFDELTNPLDAAQALSPFEALAVMWSRERAGFNDSLLQHFVRAMGIYPPGTLVQLSDGRVGVVVAAAPPNARLCPQVLVYDPATPKREAIILDLADPAHADSVKIDKALRTQERSEDELDYLLPRRKLTWFRANSA